MRLLLDTHALIWWTIDDPRLSRRAAELIRDGDTMIFVSAISAVEIATKFRLGKLDEAAALTSDFEAHLERDDFTGLPITIRHARTAGSFAALHRDPFDRLLAAQALIECMPIASSDAALDQFGIQRIW